MIKFFKALTLLKFVSSEPQHFIVKNFKHTEKLNFTINTCILNLDSTLVNILFCLLYHISVHLFLGALLSKLKI